ncbi:peptidylprolyl isomerase [Hyphobacterium sp. CCMP332]|nr:peptidylprolyl isomerase [Hyphobacterium sp. CCMP332]
MKIKIILLSFTLAIIIGAFIFPGSSAKTKNNSDHIITISTKYGDMKFILYEATPLHKENFIKLVKKGYFDSTTFHRVINQFMIQGGDPNSKDSNPNNDGLGGPGYTIPSEFNSKLFHKKGALAAARQPDAINPKKESSGSQFYIVQGRPVSNDELKRLSSFMKQDYSVDQIKIYNELGGTPHLDGEYTVFGEIISGMNVIDSISNVRVNSAKRPYDNIYMKIKEEEMKKKKITKLYNYVYPPVDQATTKK